MQTSTLLDKLVIVVFAFVGFVVVGAVELRPTNEVSRVAVVFPPWIDSADALTRAVAAGGLLIRSGQYPFIVVVQPTSSDFAPLARRQGALLFFDAQAVEGCLKVFRS